MFKKLIKRLKDKREYKKNLWSYVDLHNMRPEVEYCIKYQKMSLEEAMREWDIFPYNLKLK